MSQELVSDAELQKFLQLNRIGPPVGLSYGVVGDYCEGFDIAPRLLSYNNDLKDLQRYWMLKTIVALLPSGATLLEIGAGEPMVADILGRLGYRVIVVDPYEGAGNGPTDVDRFKELYSHPEY